MRARAFDKKKLYRLFIKTQVRKGLVNLPSGQWDRGVDNAMKRDLLSGHKRGS